MTKHEAHMKAHALWGNADRYGAACLRQRKHPARYQVGYQKRAMGLTDAEPMVVLGESAISWEDAFEKATRP